MQSKSDIWQDNILVIEPGKNEKYHWTD